MFRLSAMRRAPAESPSTATRWSGFARVSARRFSSASSSVAAPMASSWRRPKSATSGLARSRLFSLRRTDPVAHAAHRLDQLFAGAGVELLAERIDVDVDDVRREIVGVLPDARLDFRPRNPAPAPPQEELEERPFARRQAHGLAVPHDFARLRVVLHVSRNDRPGLGDFGAARERPKPGEQLPERKGLHEIVV